MKKKLVLMSSVCAAALAFTGCASSSSSSTETTTVAATTTAAETTTVSDTTTAAETTTVEDTTVADTTEAADVTKAPETDATEPGDEPSSAEDSEGMSHEEFMAADVDSEVSVVTYIQARQSWWENEGVGTASLYAQSPDGGYFIYNAQISKEDYDSLTPGAQVLVTGYKAEWSGEVEITDATITILGGENYVAEGTDVTSLLGTDDIAEYMNSAVIFRGLEIAASTDAEGNEVAFLYKWDGSGNQGDDLYFNVTDGANVYTFTVESYLCGVDTEIYQTVENYNIGDKVDLCGFLYWYEGAQPHIIGSQPASDEVSGGDESDESNEGVMSYEDFCAAEVDDEVTVATYVQAMQSWWENEGVGTASIYAQSPDGGYFIYNAQISKEDYDSITAGAKIIVTGYKAEWSGEVEIADATIQIVEGDPYVAEFTDVTEFLGADEIAQYMNQAVKFTDLQIAASKDPVGNDVAFLYKWDGSGNQGDDLYFNVTDGTNVYTFTVESYLCGADSEAYQAVEALNVGDTVDLYGFLYWYESAQPHIAGVVVK